MLQKQNAEAAAVSLRLTLLPISISSPEEIEAAFNQMRREGVQAVIFPTDATVTAERRRIARLAMDARLPSIFPYPNRPAMEVCSATVLILPTIIVARQILFTKF